jgi:hypothetical protein
LTVRQGFVFSSFPDFLPERQNHIRIWLECSKSLNRRSAGPQARRQIMRDRVPNAWTIQVEQQMVAGRHPSGHPLGARRVGDDRSHGSRFHRAGRRRAEG